MLALFPNPVGNFFVGKLVSIVGDLTTLRGARRVFCGLKKGAPDDLGYRCVVIRPEHVGMKLAIAVAIEWKDDDGVLSEEQEHCMEVLTEAGVLCGVARTTADALAIVTRLD